MIYINQKAEGNENTQSIEVKVEKAVPKLPTLLGQVIPQMIDHIHGPNAPVGSTVPYAIERKITFNNLSKYKKVVENWHQYGFIIDSLFLASEPYIKSRLYTFLNTRYMAKSGDFINAEKQGEVFVSEIETIRKFSDQILKEIIEDLITDLANDPTPNNREDIEVAVTVVVCHAFIDCKVLEKPTP